MADLINLRIDEHPLGNPNPGDFGIFRDMINGVTKKFDLTPFLTSNIDVNNIEWNSSDAAAGNYDTDEIVTYGGNIYQSEVDNNASIPGVNSDWTLKTRSPSGLVYWQAGVFLEEKVFVVSEHRDTGYPEIYFLVSATRPFNSTSISTEELAGDWRSITELTQVDSLDTSVSTVTMNFKGSVSRDFLGSVDIGADKTFAVSNASRAKRFNVDINFSTVQVLHLPSTWRVSTFAGTVALDSGHYDFTPSDAGRYNLSGWYNGTNWIVTISFIQI